MFYLLLLLTISQAQPQSFPIPIKIINEPGYQNATFNDQMIFYMPTIFGTDFTFRLVRRFPWNISFPVPSTTTNIYAIACPDVDGDWNTRSFQTPIQTKIDGVILVTLPISWWGAGFHLKLIFSS